MNILMQCCGLAVVLFLFLLYKSHRTLHLPAESVFQRFLAVASLNLLLDALSIVAIRYRDAIPDWTLQLSCKSYIISLIWVGWINFCYVSIDLGSAAKKHRRAELLTALVALAESVLVACLPLYVTENGREVYSYGPAVIAVYICTVIFIISTLATALYIRKHGSRRRAFAALVTASLWILAALIQFFDNALLLVGFSEAIGAMVLYIVMENPDSNLDRRLGCFNSYAFREYVAMRVAKDADFGLLDLSVMDLRVLESKGLNVETEAKKLVGRLSSRKDLLLFKNDLANLIVVCENEEVLNRTAEELVELIAPYQTNSNVAIFELPNARQFGDAEDLLRFLAHARSVSTSHLSALVRIPDTMIAGYRNIGIIGQEIDAALAEDRVEVFLQPICRCLDDRFVSAEALVRIRRDDGSLLSPGLFIPVAESTGQVKALGERVLEKVCAFLRDTDAVALGLQCVDINLSAVQCDDNAMAGNICHIVEQYGIESRLINFEITETAVSTAKDTLLENMEALVCKGFTFALDDFGKGESNLIYIVEMPVRFLKLDIDMSKAYFSNPKAKHVVASIADMANKLGLPIVAEGIETKEESDGIRAAGVQFIQGYYYSRPLAMDEYLTFLRERQSDASPSPEETPAASLAADRDTADTPAAAMLHGQKVLLVEDNELNREIATELLEDHAFTVDTAEDGTVAVEKIRHARPGDYDFILMDVRMPKMDGFEATRRIRAMAGSSLADIPIIALTAYADDETFRTALAAGMDGIAPKPLDVGKLISTVADIERREKRI